MQIRHAIHHLAERLEIMRHPAHMGRNKDRLRVFGEQVVLLADNLFPREVLARFGPAGTKTQFEPSLVVFIHRIEQWLGIGRVDHHRDFVFRAHVPHRVQARIIYRNTLAV